ncbi:MAG: hypothetical protein sL5_02950 [Candidatus Mesenet longicola]|uniref:ATP synthase subunit b n=1 Tax=Candidatus Mesenet longicola TaxID=1892558 RepID=A0A8J3HU62_9RICK|nr:MAG: hypothetical protein sGL2_09290 [Candidatus Mesenet longicola]GHM59302.1 MAG: hypothetical protein sL5_02950 [Candidatus Mesenet longicola]
MPQLDFSTYLSQLFWFTIFFFLLCLILSHLVLPKIETVIKRRYEAMDKAIGNASSFCALAEDEINNRKQILQKTQLEASKIISNAVKKAKLLEYNMKNLLNAEAIEMLDLVDKEIENYKIKMHNQLVEIAISVAAVYYEKLVNSHVKDYDKLKIVTNSLFKKGLL